MVPEWIEEIRRDNSSGAAVLTGKAARALVGWAAQPRTWEEVVELARALLRAQPRMAPLVNLATRAVASWPDTHKECRRFLEQLHRAGEGAAQQAADLISEGTVLMTHSYSSTVLRALEIARQQGRRFLVIATESRPMREGVALARRLAQRGISVRLVADAAAALCLREARLILVGADAISSQAVVNKIGTYMIALSAQQHRVPVYAVATSEKLLPAGYELPPELPHDPAEIECALPPGCEVLNYYFEATPLEFFAGLATEDGLLAPSAVRERLTGLQLHPALRGA